MRQKYNNIFIGLESELPLSGQSGSLFIAEDTNKVFSFNLSGSTFQINKVPIFQGGVATFNGDGTVLSYNIPHNIGDIPTSHTTNLNVDSNNLGYATSADNTNIIVKTVAAIPVGQKLVLNWFAFLK